MTSSHRKYGLSIFVLTSKAKSFFLKDTETLIAFNTKFLSLQYLGSVIIRDLRGIESTQEACARIRVNTIFNQKYININNILTSCSIDLLSVMLFFIAQSIFYIDAQFTNIE